MIEYVQRFGGAPPLGVECTTENVDQVDPVTRQSKQVAIVKSITLNPAPQFVLYYALKLYFDNGGGPCYVVSVGHYDSSPSAAHFDDEHGLGALKSEDEPTLVLAPDGVAALSGDDRFSVAQSLLNHCGSMRDRFAILDVPEDFSQGRIQGLAADFRRKMTSDLSYGAAYTPWLQTTIGFVYDEAGLNVSGVPEQSGAVTLQALESIDTRHYNSVKSALAALRVTLPPSAAVAGVYARVDRDRGVWKAPANVGLSSVGGLTQKFTDAEQSDLNVHTTGKSINAVRTFTGRGTLVWGARTLAGNDNEWRYVNVRRLFLTMEESIAKASAFAVFEPNDATTWLKVQGMIESYLYGLWERGALAGAKPAQAYFVNVGLGKTMTAENILEGNLIVEVGVAAVRPAEFVILRFSHKMQES